MIAGGKRKTWRFALLLAVLLLAGCAGKMPQTTSLEKSVQEHSHDEKSQYGQFRGANEKNGWAGKNEKSDYIWVVENSNQGKQDSGQDEAQKNFFPPKFLPRVLSRKSQREDDKSSA